MGRNTAACLAALLLSASVGPAIAQAPDQFYKDRRIEVLVGSGTGGGYDDYARVLTRHMGRHMPGDPSFVIKNLQGGGGRTALININSVMAKDGSAFGTVIKNVVFDPLYGVDVVKMDPTRFGWLGSLNSEVSLCVVWHTAGVKSLDDARGKELRMGSNGPTITDSIFVRFLNRVAGTRLKDIVGYPSSTAIHIAMERGEVDGRCGLGYDSIVSRYAHWIRDKKVHFLAQFALQKHSDLPDTPFIMDLVRTDEDRQIAELLLAPNEMGRPYLAPPEVPRDRLAVLRRAFAASAKDPELLDQAKKQNVVISLLTGEQVEAMVARIYKTPPSVVAITRKIVDPR